MSSRARPAFLARYVFVRSRDQFFDRQTRDFHPLRALTHAHAHEVSDNTSVARLLLAGPDPVQKVDGVTFWPGQPEIVEEDGETRLNFWRRPNLIPKVGSVSPFLHHIGRIFDGDETATSFALDYLAQLVQQPDKKMKFVMLIIGGQGTGKSMLADMSRHLVGWDNTQGLSPTALVAVHNEWVQRAQLVIVHELVGDDNRGTSARMKELITEETILVNPKGVTAYQQRNRANFILLTNEADAAKLDPDDRRYFVWNSQPKTPRSRHYHLRLWAWFMAGGRERVLQYLITRDLSGFDPYRAPPRTAGRTDLVEASRDPSHDYLRDKVEAGDAPFACDLFTVAEVRDYLAIAKQLRLTTRAIGGIMRALGAKELGQKRIRGSKPRIWAVRDVERWANASEEEIAGTYLRPESPSGSSRRPMRPNRCVAHLALPIPDFE